MEETRKNVGADLMSSFLHLVEKQGQMPTNQMMAMFGLYALVNILNLAQLGQPVPRITNPAQGIPSGKLDKDALMETLGGLLKSQGMNAEELVAALGAKGNTAETNPADLLGALGKNPAALVNFMNLLTSAKEAMQASRKEEKTAKKPEEPKTIPFKERNT